MHNSFLGTGWSFPPSFNLNSEQGTAEVEMVSDEADVVQSLEVILSTRPGERVMLPNFGCDLSQFMFKEITQGLITSIRGIISDAILYHEPRVDVDEIEVSETEEPGLLRISVIYTIRTTNSRFNLVYPFYINEANIPV